MVELIKLLSITSLRQKHEQYDISKDEIPLSSLFSSTKCTSLLILTWYLYYPAAIPIKSEIPVQVNCDILYQLGFNVVYRYLLSKKISDKNKTMS